MENAQLKYRLVTATVESGDRGVCQLSTLEIRKEKQTELQSIFKVLKYIFKIIFRIVNVERFFKWWQDFFSYFERNIYCQTSLNLTE